MITLATTLATVITSESVKALGLGYAMGTVGASMAKSNSK